MSAAAGYLLDGSDPIDIAEPIREICERLGLTYNLVASLEFRPLDVRAECYVPNENGKPYINEDGEAPMETRIFEVRT